MDALVAQLGEDRVQRPRRDLEAVSIEWPPSISTSGSTIGTRPASWQSAAYRARACAFVQRQYSLGMPSPIVITARHLVNRAPSDAYSLSRSRSPSSPSVIFSPGAWARSFAPLSTLIPGMTP